MENKKPIVIGVIGTGLNSVTTRLAMMDLEHTIIQLSNEMDGEALTLLKDENDLIIRLDTIDEDFNKRLNPTIEPLLIKSHRVDYVNRIDIIKENNKPKEYPKQNWKRKLKKNKKR